MTQAAKAQEPSMEEILASIRRIIADDDVTRSPPSEAPPPPRAAAVPPRLATPPRPAAPPPAAAFPPAPDEAAVKQAEIDAMLAKLQATSTENTPEAEEPASDILDLTEQMTAPAFGPRSTAGQSDAMFEESFRPEPEPAPTAPQVRPSFPERRDRSEQGLMSTATSAAVDSAFNTLAQTVLVQNGRTLEDLVREMLRPMLKTWLDDNLPGMVERLVRAEIERVSRGRT
jgi:uncharacterized protein